jgi:hypothetical protein
MPKAHESTNAFADLFEKGFEQVLEASKTSLDMAVKYNHDVLEATRKSLNLAPNTPGLFLFDVAGKALENYAELQKNLLNSLGQHGTAAASVVREAGKVAANTVSAFQQSAERTAAAHKAVLDFATKQNKQVVEAVKQQEGIKGTPLAEMADAIERGMEALIEAQKAGLESAVNQLKTTTKAA